jgi:hypothetical protein
MGRSRTLTGVSLVPFSRWKRLRWSGVLGGAVSLLAAQACNGIDTARVAPTATLGDDMYSVLCDRLGASVLGEDLEGRSFHGVCHFASNGLYADTVDVTALPVIPGEAVAKARALSVAKLERLAAHRTDLIRAFNAAFPETNIPDYASGDPKNTAPLHAALLHFTQALTKLYDGNPYESGGAPLMPAATDALGRMLADMEKDAQAVAALSRASGRRGYRADAVGFGALASLLNYPELSTVTRAFLDVLGPEEAGATGLQALLGAAEQELATTTCTLCSVPPLTSESGTSLNRPREAAEFLERLALEESDAYAAVGDDDPRYIVRRDTRGFAIPKGNVPGVKGTVPAPFADANEDGFADVDARGRFVDGSGSPLAVEPPFAVRGEAHGPLDAFDRPASGLYEYIDVSRTFLASVTRDIGQLMDATTYAGGAPDAWKTEHEAVMYALGGLHVLAGDRQLAQFDHDADKVLPPAAPCTSKSGRCTSYSRFVAEASPLPDLAHGLGQLLADSESDLVLAALETLVREHEDVVARLVDAGLRVKAIADKHDALAAEGKEPKAELPYTTPIWDELAELLGKTADHPGLIAELTKGLASDVMVSPAAQDPKIPGGKAQHLGETLSAFAAMRDQYGYDPADLNGVALNVTDGGNSLANPHNPVDRQKALAGDNRSMLERSLQLIHDSAGVKACNKNGAKLHTKFADWPIFGGYGECKLFVFPDIGAFYLDALLAPTHPKRAELQVKATDVNELMDFIGQFSSTDKLLESSAGITGMTLHPSPAALNRLLFFGADSDTYGKLSDYDASNADTDTMQFISGSIEPVSSIVCPTNANGVPVCGKANSADVLRMRDRGTIFGWERLGFQSYLAPIVEAFATLACNPAVTQCDVNDFEGERLFLGMLDVFWRHWPDKEHGPYCDAKVPRTAPNYCSGAGVSHYEPIVSEAMLTDVVPALHDFAKVATEVDLVVERGPNKGQVVNGSAIVEQLVRVLFSQSYADGVGMVNRLGKAKTQWVDGTPQTRVTVFSILADALHGMDERFANSALPDAADRKAKWKRARSLLVDQFLSVEGSGASARFANRAVPAVLLATLRALREQTNARCPSREANATCDWARRDLSKSVEDFLAGPVFAGLADMVDALNQNESARREVERLAQWVLLGKEDARARVGLLASLGDGLQLLKADRDWAPLLASASSAFRPAASPDGPGAVDRGLLVLDAATSQAVDPDRVLSFVLPLLVTPTDGGQGRIPLEVLIETLADVNRYDARESTPLAPEDVGYVMRTVREFFVSKTRGFAQLYAIVQNRPN